MFYLENRVVTITKDVRTGEKVYEITCKRCGKSIRSTSYYELLEQAGRLGFKRYRDDYFCNMCAKARKYDWYVRGKMKAQNKHIEIIYARRRR